MRAEPAFNDNGLYRLRSRGFRNGRTHGRFPGSKRWRVFVQQKAARQQAGRRIKSATGL